MADDDKPNYLSILKEMRDELVQRRRSNVMDNNMTGVIEAQEMLEAIDRAISDETQLGKSAQAQVFLRNL